MLSNTLLHDILHSDEWLTLLQICPVQKIPQRKRFIFLLFFLVFFKILFYFIFLSAVFAFLENGPDLIYRNKLEISMEKLWDCSEQKGNLIMVNIVLQPEGESWRHCWRTEPFLLSFSCCCLSQLLSCYLGESGDQKGQQRPWKHSARIWNLNWGVANAYFLLRTEKETGAERA